MYQREEVLKCNELERDVGGLIQKDDRKKKFKDRALVIEHYSRLLDAKKISVKRFLCVMSNMDNKVAFEEFEYPALDVNDIEFETEGDREQFLNEQQSASMDVKKDKVKAKRKRVPKVVRNQEEVVLTRSKARKAAAQKEKQSNNPIATSSNTVSVSAILTRSQKRRAEELDDPIDGNNIQLERASAKRASRIDLESSNNDLEAVTGLMSSSIELNRLNERFNEILNGEKDAKTLHEANKSMQCIMSCNRIKATVLLPCKHQPTCNQCYVLWRLFVSQKQRNVICLLCKNPVTSNIVVSDD